MGISSEFRFWEERLPIHPQNSGHSSGEYAEFRVRKHHDQDQFSPTNPPPLWTKLPKNPTREVKSPLLPQDHHCSSCLSPKSRFQAILDGKRELMEIIKDLPESSLELSLKDIVEDHAEVKEVVLIEEKKTNEHKIGERIIQRNDSNIKSRICRSESMESGVFLLKMFLPASLISHNKKRSDSKKWPNSGPRPAPEGSENSRTSTRWWKIIFLSVRDYNNRRNVRRNNREIKRGKNRLVDEIHMPCQWSLCIHRKCRSSRGHTGCLF